MYNILLTGAGQIGSRHLQGLMRLRSEVSIGVLDISAASLKLAKERAEQVGIPDNVRDIFYWNSIDEITFDKADLAIVATNADIRPVVIRDLLGALSVKNMVLEKVAFQSPGIFDDIIALLDRQGVRAWVNTPRRIYPYYKELKRLAAGKESIDMMVTGSGWGLACNMIHYLDLFAYLTGSSEISHDYSVFDSGVVPSKRSGFYEVNGRTGFSNSRGSLHLSCTKTGYPGFIIQVQSGDSTRVISEAGSKVFTFDAGDLQASRAETVAFPYQSELSGLVAEEILLKGSCGLPGLRESRDLHKLFLPVLSAHFAGLPGGDLQICPIS